MTRTALIIGATGGFGGEVAEALHRRGWRVRALARKPKQAARTRQDMPFIEWVG